MSCTASRILLLNLVFIAYLRNAALLQAGFNVVLVHGQQIFGDFLQGLEFLGRDVGSVILLKAKNENPSVSLVGRQQGTCAAALATTGKGYALLDDPTSQIGVDQAAFHFADGLAERGVVQFRFAHPFGEVPGFQYVFHEYLYST